MWPLRSPHSPSDGLTEAEWTQVPPESPKALRWAIIWGAILGGLGLFDLWRHSKRDGSTLSEAVRFTLATDTPEGRALFESGLTVLHQHILK